MWPLYDSVKTFNEFHQRRFKRHRMLKITCETDTGILQNRNDLNGSGAKRGVLQNVIKTSYKTGILKFCLDSYSANAIVLRFDKCS